jgi:tetratricopeptide (TPR) repeat protein
VNVSAKLIALLVALLPFSAVMAESASSAVRQGNMLYAQNKYNDAIKKYDQALADDPLALESTFNKANSYYKLDDIANASDLYKAVAAQSKDMKLVEKAKYNLGNCSYQQGLKQKDSDLQKSLEEFKTAIGYWRQALDINPRNDNAARNIETARLMIKDIIDQINKKQQDPNNPQNKDQQNQQQKQQDNKQQNSSSPNDANQQQQQKENSQSDQNNGSEPNQSQNRQKKENQQDQSKSEKQKQQSQEPKDQQKQEQQTNDKKEVTAPDATAQEILDREQKDRKEREMLRRSGYQKVDKDW